MKTFKKLSLLGLFAISMAATSSIHAEDLSMYFQQEINTNFEALINGSKTFDEAITALKDVANKENNQNLLEDIAFLQQNRKQILTCLGKIKQLYAKIETYLDGALKTQINKLRLDQWIRILMR